MEHSILCVDADRNLVQVMGKALAAQGYAVTTEHDGERALERIAEAPPSLVLLDLFLPGRDGFSVLEAIRAMPEPAASIPVVLLSSCTATPEYRERAARLDACALLNKPVALERLVTCVSGRLGLAVQDAGSGAASDGVLEGDLERFPFSALLHHLHGSRASGVLHLDSGRKRKWVQLRGGYPVAVRSNLLAETLGGFLERSGRVAPAVVNQSRDRLGQGQLQGEILVAMQVLDEDDLADALRAQAQAKLLEVFAWGAGHFRFEFGAQLHRASGLAGLNPANLILRGVRERVPIERVDTWLHAMEHCLLTPAVEPFYRFQAIDLTLEERALIDGLGSGSPIASFLESDEPVRRAVFALVQAGGLSAGVDAPVWSEAVAVPSLPSRPVDPETDAAERSELESRIERFADQSPFEILDVPDDVGEAELRAAYASLSAQVHPDRIRTGGPALRALATEAFGHVERAYQSLSDPKQRQLALMDHRRAERAEREREEGRRAYRAEHSYQRGEVCMEARDYEGALVEFGKALELHPGEGEYSLESFDWGDVVVDFFSG